METQIAELKSALNDICANQTIILTHLEKVDKEILDLKSSNNSNIDDSVRPKIPGLYDTTPSVHAAPTLHGPSRSAGTAVESSHTLVDHVGNVISVQDEFQSIKDKLSAVKIPQELRVGTSRNGIRREDNTAANIIANSAKYVETTIKLLWNLDENPSSESLIELFSIQKAHIEYLRQEHSGLVVAGQFGNKTSQLFKNLARGTSNLDDHHLDILSKAVQITSHDTSGRPPSTRGSFRGRGGFGASTYHSGRGGGRGWQPWRGAYSTPAGTPNASAVNASINRDTNTD